MGIKQKKFCFKLSSCIAVFLSCFPWLASSHLSVSHSLSLLRGLGNGNLLLLISHESLSMNLFVFLNYRHVFIYCYQASLYWISLVAFLIRLSLAIYCSVSLKKHCFSASLHLQNLEIPLQLTVWSVFWYCSEKKCCKVKGSQECQRRSLSSQKCHAKII